MILLDTHALLWLDARDERLGLGARSSADEALNHDELMISAISFCEIAALVRQGRILLRLPIATWVEDIAALGLREVMVDAGIAIASVALEQFHRDPADRIIVATALALDATLLTADERILGWSGPLQRHDARR